MNHKKLGRIGALTVVSLCVWVLSATLCISPGFPGRGGRAGVLCFNVCMGGSDDRDPWYEDLDRHWAEEYVRTLWEEGVSDGDVYTVRRRRGRRYVDVVCSKFRPDMDATRAQIAMLLVKAMDLDPVSPREPTFSDVPPGYQAYVDKEAFHYIEAASRAGIMGPLEEGRFYPDRATTREDTIASLMRTLGLEEYARSLPPSEVEEILRRYRDRRNIGREYRPYIAAATKLKIVEGYEDGTVKPRKDVTRAEMATMVYRSCLVRASADPGSFSPDGDGFQDTCAFLITGMRNRNARRWVLEIAGYSGATFKTFTGDHLDRRTSVTWDGTGDRGELLGEGTYYYRAAVEDRHGQTFRSVWKPVSLQFRRLHASLSPDVVSWGDVVRVRASTTGEARRVLVVASGFPSQLMKPLKDPASSVNEWNGAFQVDRGFPAGQVEVRVIADFGTVSRTQDLSFTVLKPDHRDSPGGSSNQSKTGKGEDDSVEPLNRIIFSLTG